MSEQKVDQLLVERVQRGDKAAFDTLVLKYQLRIMKLVSRYIRDHSEVQDVAQEAVSELRLEQEEAPSSDWR